MKRLTPIILAILSIISLLAFSGCSLFTGGSGTGNPIAQKTTITLCDGSYSQDFEVTIGQQAKITELTKQGYYLTGYYDSETGGEKYFDASGKSTAVWSASNPTTFYAQYKPIDEFVMTTTFAKSGTHEFSYHTHGNITGNAEFQNALKANLNKNLKVEYSLNGYDSDDGEDWIVYFKNVDSYNEGNLTKDKIASKYYGKVFIMSSSFKTISGTASIPANYIYSGEGFVTFVSRGASFGEGKFKNFNLIITFTD